MSTVFPADAEELLAQVALANRVAFRSLYQKTAAHLFPVALRIVNDREKAEDALQDAFVQIWNRAAEYQAGRGSAGAWMSTIVRYRALDIVRKTRPEISDELVSEAAAADDPIARLMQGSDLQLCFEDLTVEQRQAVGMAYVEGLSHSELSARLDTPLGTVKSWVRRGLKALKECLSQ